MIIIENIELEQFMGKARDLMEHRDLKDADYIACALATDADFIWSNDKDFSAQGEISVKSTQQFIDEQKDTF